MTRHVSDLKIGERVYVHHRAATRTGMFAGVSDLGAVRVDLPESVLSIFPPFVEYSLTDIDGVEVFADPPD